MIWLISLLGCLIPLQDGISDAEFQKLHAEVVTKPATWRTIPWQTTMIEAQNIALRENKLIFIWSMDGHPLGCT